MATLVGFGIEYGAVNQQVATRLSSESTIDNQERVYKLIQTALAPSQHDFNLLEPAITFVEDQGRPQSQASGHLRILSYHRCYVRPYFVNAIGYPVYQT